MAYQGLDTLAFINEAEITKVLEWGPLIDAMERAMISFSAGDGGQGGHALPR
jgi:hypothetical protein